MVGWGIFLIVMGAGSLLLPMVGVQFRLMELADAYQPYAGIVAAVIGAVLVFMGMNRSAGTRVPADQGNHAGQASPATQPGTEDPYRRP